LSIYHYTPCYYIEKYNIFVVETVLMDSRSA